MENGCVTSVQFWNSIFMFHGAGVRGGAECIPWCLQGGAWSLVNSVVWEIVSVSINYCVYSIEKRTVDLQWRLIHGAITTNRHVAHLNPAVGKECPLGWKSLLTIYLFKCSRLRHLFIVLNDC